MSAAIFHFPRRAAASLALWFALTALSACGAMAGSSDPVLREQVKVHADLVRLGDIFEHAGTAASVAVFRSPDLGTRGVVGADRIKAAAHQHGLFWNNPGGVEQVTVERPGRLVSLEEITSAVAAAAAEEMNVASADEVEATLERRSHPYHVDPRITGQISVKRLFIRQGGVFEAELGFEGSDFRAPDKVFRGRVEETMEVPVPSRPIERGETIPRGDVKMMRMPRAKLRGGIVMDAGSLTGMAAKRTLAADEPVRANDVDYPKLVTRNALVTIVYRTGGLVLKTQGLAQADAHEGASVPVLNTHSKRIIQGVVRGPGLVAIETPGTTLAMNEPPRARAQRRGAGPGVVR